MPSPHLALDAIGFRHGARPILDRLSLQVAAGERVGILGPSGVGKSTLLQIVAGLVAPSSGELGIDGASVTGPVPGATMMFQRPALLPWASVLDNVLLPSRLMGRRDPGRRDPGRRDPGRRDSGRRDEARSEALRLLGEVGLADRVDAKPHALSGGQQQRVALARALASRPRILLLDEPFSALDPEMRAALRADVKRLAQERGLTLLIVTHDPADVAALAERAVVLGGRPAGIVADFTLASEADLRARLGGHVSQNGREAA
ncbi:ABC transporter ATP-binding protein [Methylobacterium sp. W2]|uniref:ABC transporter ATP-binding protein n=1 Tax=Methylobacterium sp. W2 TaxID=2598107 RepID=UPI001D0C7DBC|nr:ABC transporter ATP-binding protein [Methylobacterium sp. W2]